MPSKNPLAEIFGFPIDNLDKEASRYRKNKMVPIACLPMQNLEGLFAADCVDFMEAMPDECVDLAVTSPPYDNLRDYKGYSFEFERIADGLFRVIWKYAGII
jgi:hypothetical protein